MSYETIEVRNEDGVSTITLNRPERLNAYTYLMGAEMEAAIVAGNEDDDVEAFVLTGAGRGFCAGADIQDLFQAQADGDVERPETGDWVSLIRSSKPFVAAVNGAAIGLGLSQIMSMDYIVASTDAKLSCRFIKMGVVPELASSRFMFARCGFGTASELMLSGKTIDAEEALRIGLVDRVTSPKTSSRKRRRSPNRWEKTRRWGSSSSSR